MENQLKKIKDSKIIELNNSDYKCSLDYKYEYLNELLCQNK